MDLSEKILKLRKAHGLSQDELSDKLGITRQSISKWESGQANPELENVVKLAEIFDVNIEYLLRPSETDELKLKTSMLEKQQENIMNLQKKSQNRQFLIISIILAILAIAVVFLVGKYVMFPGNGISGNGMFGKLVIMYGGTIIVIATTIYVNWRFRTKARSTTIN